MSVVVCAATAGTVLLINSVLTLWASTRFHTSGGLATIQEGSCHETKNLSLWLHLGINVLSTVLLSASNYSMQCLSSPTREEVDKAHRKKVWLDIGVPSVRNLHQISWYRIALWWSLALSGIPLHLLYNSAVFSTLATTEYSVFAGSPDLLTGKGVNWSQPVYPSSTLTLQMFRNASSWQRLENDECIKAYGQPYVSAHGDLLAITANLNESDPAVLIANSGFGFSPGQGVAYQWICATANTQNTGSVENCNLGPVLSKASTWTLRNTTSTSSYDASSLYNDLPVEYCLSKSVEERCRLQFSLVIMGIVIGCNLAKIICMVLTLWYHKSQPLVTLGDAISSFLDHPDPATKNMCLANKSSFAWRKSDDAAYAGTNLQDLGKGQVLSDLSKKKETETRKSPILETTEEQIRLNRKWESGLKRWQNESYRWFRAATLRR